MDRRLLQQHLEQAERHIALGKQHLAKQEAIIAELDRDGHDTTDALAILVTLRETRSLHVQDRDRILSELGSRLRPADQGGSACPNSSISKRAQPRCRSSY